MGLESEIEFLFNKRLHLPDLLNFYTDIRKVPVIRLRDIITQVFLMPFYSQTSLLSMDRLSRTRSFKKLFGCRRKMVASDTTVKRVLDWLSIKESKQFLTRLLGVFEKERLLRTRLSDEGNLRRIGIIDGSCMGGHWVEVFSLHGRIDYPILIEPYGKRGKELSASKQVIDQAASLLRSAFPDLILADSLYFNSNSFKKIRKAGAHILIKSADPSFRMVLQDSKFLFENKDDVDAPIHTSEGFDSLRWCSWKSETTSGEFAGFPIQVVHVHEYYPKRSTNQTTDFWIVTTDLSLSSSEIREAAHLRWRIENNTFKRLSHHSGTKRFYCKRSKAFINLLRIFCAAVSTFDALISILKRKEGKFKLLLDGIKPTWRNIFSRLSEQLRPNIFR